MTRGDQLRIADIVDACQEVAVVVALREAGGVDERVLTRAVERLLEIIGEAAGRISDATCAQYPGVDWRALARLRIVLAHHYHRTDPDLVWSYARDEVPALARALAG